ncbi:MAG: hypothetical protein ACYDAO_02490 [Thermoplasmataceae archaeon]
MNKQELLDKIEELKNSDDTDDTEMEHKCADRLLLNYINDKDITNAYDKIEKWYS